MDKAAQQAARARKVRIIFDGPPDHESGRFVEVEDENGHSVSVGGEWVEDDRKPFWALVIDDPRDLPAALDAIERLEGEVERLRGLLTKHQYAGTAHGAYGTVAPRCPECGGIAPGASLHTGSFDGKYEHGGGHKTDCAIAAALEGGSDA